MTEPPSRDECDALIAKLMQLSHQQRFDDREWASSMSEAAALLRRYRDAAHIPRQPTPEMIEALPDYGNKHLWRGRAIDLWTAMWDAFVRRPPRTGNWKVGNEFAPYHPMASHVSPDYRDGWNACYHAVYAAPKALQEPAHAIEPRPCENLPTACDEYPACVCGRAWRKHAAAPPASADRPKPPSWRN